MDKNRVEGAKHQVKGGLKEAAGKLTGNKTKDAAGKLEKNAGKVQQDGGKAADAARRPQALSAGRPDASATGRSRVLAYQLTGRGIRFGLFVFGSLSRAWAGDQGSPEGAWSLQGSGRASLPGKRCAPSFH